MALSEHEVEKVIVENKEMLYHIAYRFLGSIDNYDIKDLYMEVALSFYDAAQYYDESLKVDFKTLAFQNATRRLSNLHRRQNTVKRKCPKTIMYEIQIREHSTSYGDFVVVDPHSYRNVENNIFVEEIKKLAKEILTDKEHEIFIEYCKGYNSYEIAEKFGYNPKTTSNIIYKIKNKLKSAIKI